MRDPEPPEPLDVEGVRSRAWQAYHLQLAGLDLSEIALRLQYPSPTAVVKAISDEIKAEARKLPSPTRSDLLSLQIDRLNYMLSKLWQQVEYGDLATVNTALKIVDMQCKLLGLHIPDATTQSNTVLVVGGAEADYIRALQSAS